MIFKITSDSHVDHLNSRGFELEDWRKLIIRAAKKTESNKVVTQTIKWDETLRSGCRKVDEYDVTVKVTRKGRGWPSHVCNYLKGEKTTTITVITGPHKGECVLYTAYPGEPAPREPGDPSLTDPDDIRESEEFWEGHALTLSELSDEVYDHACQLLAIQHPNKRHCPRCLDEVAVGETCDCT